MDFNFIKIQLQTPNISSSSYFSVSTVPGTGSAPGFDFSQPFNPSRLNWSIALKLINTSNEPVAVEDIKTIWFGDNNYRTISNKYFSLVYIAKNSEEDFINLLSKDDKQQINLPLLIRSGEQKVLELKFTMETFQRVFFWHKKSILFKKNEVVAPDTYEKLLRKVKIKIRINKRLFPFTIKIG